MMKFNKTVLALAVAGAMMLPAASMAATLTYATGTQITFAKDLIVNNGTTIYTSNSLQLAAQTSDAANMATVAAGDVVKVKVTLTNNAKFDTTADAPTLVNGFFEGVQLGGTPNAIATVGTPYYSTSGQELNFEFTATGPGVVGAPGDYTLELNSMQITNLVDGLATGNSVGAEITMQNSLGQQILAAKQTIALSKWGLTTTDVASPDTSKTIDVGSSPRKTLFVTNGSVGGSATDPNNGYFNAGGFALDIAQANPVGSAIPTYINNYNAVAANPQYNVVATADIAVTVTGADLTAFGGSRVWLDGNSSCTKAPGNFTNGTVAGGVASFASPANIGIWAPITAASPGPATAYVCFGADNVHEMQPQDLKGDVTVDYKLVTQRVNPPVMPFTLLPLRLNGTTVIFQNVNPGANPTAQSFLRLTNNNAEICPVTIDAKDDSGLHSGNVQLTLAPHGSKQLNSEVLEGTASQTGVTGGFGDGAGKWYVRVTAECTNFKASALNRNSQSGTVTDLTPEKGNGNEWLTPSNSL